MNINTEKAFEILTKNKYTCVICKDEKKFTSRKRGIKPLLEFLESDTDFVGASAADKVVGKAAAFIYVLIGVKEVYAPVISVSAKKVFSDNGIKCFYEKMPDMIINREGTGCCPLEYSVKKTENVEEALVIIKKNLEKLK